MRIDRSVFVKLMLGTFLTLIGGFDSTAERS